MEKKYELTDETYNHYGKKLYRIRALKNFDDVKAGDLGGFVEKEENLSQHGRCWIYDDAKVYEDAKVWSDAKIYDFAHIFGKAEIRGYAKVYDNAMILDTVHVYENAEIRGNVKVFNTVRVYGNAKLDDEVVLDGGIDIRGNSEIKGDIEICVDSVSIFGNALIKSEDDYAFIKGFGRANRETIFFLGADNIIYVCCGCFEGSIDEFVKKIKETHKNSYLAKEYLAIVRLMKKRFKRRNRK